MASSTGDEMDGEDSEEQSQGADGEDVIISGSEDANVSIIIVQVATHIYSTCSFRFCFTGYIGVGIYMEYYLTASREDFDGTSRYFVLFTQLYLRALM